MFACDEAELDGIDGKWILKNPWSVVALPKNCEFPFRVDYLWVYVHLAGGVGISEVMIEMVQHMPDGTRIVRGRGPARQLEFHSADRFVGVDFAFRLKRVPFPAAGLYEFRVVSGGDQLTGHIAELQVLDNIN